MEKINKISITVTVAAIIAGYFLGANHLKIYNFFTSLKNNDEYSDNKPVVGKCCDPISHQCNINPDGTCGIVLN